MNPPGSPAPSARYASGSTARSPATVRPGPCDAGVKPLLGRVVTDRVPGVNRSARAHVCRTPTRLERR